MIGYMLNLFHFQVKQLAFWLSILQASFDICYLVQEYFQPLLWFLKLFNSWALFTITHLSCAADWGNVNYFKSHNFCVSLAIFTSIVLVPFFVPLGSIISCTELGIGLFSVLIQRKEICPTATEALYSHTITSNSVDLVTRSVPSARWQKLLMYLLKGTLWKPSPALIWC